MSDISVPQHTYAGLDNFVEIIEPRGGTVEWSASRHGDPKVRQPTSNQQHPHLLG